MDSLNGSICPIVCGAPLIGEYETVFSFAQELIHIQVPGLLMNCIIEACNGQRSLELVIDSLKEGWNHDTLIGFFRYLLEKGVLRDSSNLSGYIWPFVSNPSHFAKVVTDDQISEMVDQSCVRNRSLSSDQVFPVKNSIFRKLILNRRSKRVFSGNTVAIENIICMLWAGYGIIADSYDEDGFDRHSVPSAGALYPLRLSLVLFQSLDNELVSGVYDVSFLPDGSVGLTFFSSNLTLIYQSFADPLISRGAAGVVVVSGSFDITEAKYGNRAILYVPLEVGHVVQNIHLAAIDLGVATVEIGGFLEDSMREALFSPKTYTPLITVVFGEQADTDSLDALLSTAFEVRWMPPKVGGYVLPFNMVFARLKNPPVGNEDWSCGRSEDPFIAYAKAISETEEWASCGYPKGIIRSEIRSLRGAVLPSDLVAFHPDQYELSNFPFFAFDLRRVYEWKLAIDVVNGENRYVIADCIYFPYYPEYPRYASANSSGAATYPTRDGAIERGVLELIERDAFMIVWLNRLVMPTIRVDTLPENIQYRIQKLEEAGFIIVIKDLTLDLTPVILVFAQSESLCYTTCSACSSFDIIEALERALMEVESAVYCRLAFGSSEPILPEDVRMTQDHGKLYEQETFFRSANFLMESRFLRKLSEVGKGACFHWEALLERFTEQGRIVLAVDLESIQACGDQLNLYRVKTFVTGLVPISFGYGEEPCGMKRIYEAPVALGFYPDPLGYDDLNKFPHPYT
ncbi:MAG: YcaO-like family protein [Candidatus Moranbacteria bacterium]|nr:YcaO-like family protein [Candidatus Moranbacteria bacterium]